MRAPLIAAVIVTLCSPLHATSIKAVNLEEMTALADRIFLGRVVGIRRGFDDAAHRPVTFTTFEVLRPVKGKLGQTVTIKTLASAIPGQSALVAGMPTFRAGEETVLFLHGDSKLGLTSPVGLYQGRLEVRGESGTKVVRGPFHEQGLLRGVRTGWLRSAVLGRAAPGIQAQGVARGASQVDLNTLLDSLDRLAK